MPRLGDTVDEVTILTWLVGDGDLVSIGDPLLRVETDKVDVEVPSPVAGIVSGRAPAVGDIVSTGSLICLVQPIDRGGP